jgi:hypothetical protein
MLLRLCKAVIMITGIVSQVIEFRWRYSDRNGKLFKEPSRRNGTVLLIVPFKINSLISFDLIRTI